MTEKKSSFESKKIIDGLGGTLTILKLTDEAAAKLCVYNAQIPSEEELTSDQLLEYEDEYQKLTKEEVERKLRGVSRELDGLDFQVQRLERQQAILLYALARVEGVSKP